MGDSVSARMLHMMLRDALTKRASASIASMYAQKYKVSLIAAGRLVRDRQFRKSRFYRRIISTEDSAVKVAAVPTDEELAIARETVVCLGGPGKADFQ